MTTTATETRSLKFWQGINQALIEEMERDERVVLVGEDVARPGGPYGVTLIAARSLRRSARS